MNDPILKLAIHDLVEQHRCHTLILYGSRSRGDWTDESDYDLMGFRDEGEKLRDARIIEGKFLDAFVYPVKDVINHERDFLRVRNGTLLLGKDPFVGNLLKKLDEVFDQGPNPLPEDELQAIRIWIGKMLTRIAKNDLKGNYR